MIHGLSTAGLGPPDYDLAMLQHAKYAETLKKCGLEVVELDADERYPDSTFVEDVALLTKECAIVTRPGVPSRRGETLEIMPVLEKYYKNVEQVKAPGTVEAGDIMMVGTHFYIGISKRTNETGARQVIKFLEKYGASGSIVHLKKVLHLKTGIAYLEEDTMIASGEFLDWEEFRRFRILEIAPEECYAANCIRVNDRVIIPAGFPGAKCTIEDAGFKTDTVDVSEFRKLDGGLSCLSLRF